MNGFEINQQSIDQMILMVWGYVPRLVLAILTLIIGFWLSKRIATSILAAFKLNKVDPSLAGWMSSFLSITLKAVVIISVASMIGIETTSFIAVLGAAGLAVGLALQGSLANFAGGLLILFFKPFVDGDYINAQGEEGIVERIDIFCTYLKTFDNKIIILPNGALAGNKIINLTALDERRVDISVGISYRDNFKKAESALISLGLSDSRVFKTPEPIVRILSYGESSIDLSLRVWCKTTDYWDVQHYLNSNLKDTLEHSGISIPYPQRDLHVYNHQA